MKLLLDANISRRIIPELAPHFDECIHVNTIGLSVPLADIQIWDYAQQHDYIIVTQDSDFLHFYETKGYPPKVVLLRMGKMTKDDMLSVIIRSKQLIEDLHKGDYGLLEIVEKKNSPQ
jgi:predicted nuclease of predicted toxin-antitoxin system